MPTYPCLVVAQPYADVKSHLKRTIAFLTSCEAPTPESEKLQQWYLAILKAMQAQCPSGPPAHLVDAYKVEYHKLDAELAAADRRRDRTCKRTAAPVVHVAE
jgi:hypothetical protein